MLISTMAFRGLWKSLTTNVRCRTAGKELFLIASFALVTVYLIRTKLPYLKYPFQKDKSTIKYFNRSKIIVVENSWVLRKDIKRIYKGAAAFCTAKEKSDFAREVKYLCSAGRNIIVVNKHSLCLDDDHCIKDLLDPLPALAEQYKYTLFISSLNQEIIPLYTGWLLNDNDSADLLSLGRNTLEELLVQFPSFFDSFKKFSQLVSIKEMLSYYKLAASNANGMLHCTAKYLANGTARGSVEYWKSREVISNLSRCYVLNIIGFVWTPRTFGARVKLASDELRLWDNIDEMKSELNQSSESKIAELVNEGGEPDFAPVKGRGSRAHLTLGVAEDVPAVVTGQDLLEVVHFESEPRNWTTYNCSLGWLRDYGNGVWVLYSAQNYWMESIFGGVYNR